MLLSDTFCTFGLHEASWPAAFASFFFLQNLSIPQGLAYFPFLEESPLTSGSPRKILIYSLYHLVLITQLGLDKHCHDWHIYLFYT